jgi:FkbM family methyltransferase
MELIDLARSHGARVIYDIGANVGTWSLLCRALIPDSTIVAFEPMAEHWPAFRANTLALANLTMLPVALGSSEQTLTFHPVDFTDASSFLPLTAAASKLWNIKNSTPRQLSVRTLDAVVATESLPSPDLIKLDVQGFELEVLKGATKTLNSVSWVLSEVSFSTLYEGQPSFSEYVTFLATLGFEVYAFGQSLERGVPLIQADVLFHRR